MSQDVLSDLRERIASKQVVVFVGAGVSIGASGNFEVDGQPVASWGGLLRHGVERCSSVMQDDKWTKRRIDQLEAGEYVEVGALITKGLGGPTNGEFRKWLDETVGKLPPRDPEVLEALRDLGAPLFTTNYDKLLEDVTHRQAATWRDGNTWQTVVNSPDSGIVHLHGYFGRPDSVVLGGESYVDVMRDPQAQNALKSLASSRSLIFVGFGAGLDDPNFSGLRTFMSNVLSDSAYRHYRLVPESEANAAREEHDATERIVVVPFGTHEQLPEFLRSLRPPANRPAPERRVLEVEIGADGVIAHVQGGAPAKATLDLNSTRVETVQLLDEWLRLYAEGAGVPGGIERIRIVRHLGRVLHEAVFHDAVKDLYDKVRPPAGEKLAIVLSVRNDSITLPDGIQNVSLSSLPWELLFNVRDGCLATNRSLTLSRALPKGSREVWKAQDKVRIFVTLAEPTDLVKRVKAEWESKNTNTYEEVVHGIVHDICKLSGDVFVVPSSGPPTLELFEESLNKQPPYHIVHYIGHGSAGPSGGAGGSIALVGENGEASWYSFEEFAGLFRDNPPYLVFLHLCEGPHSRDEGEGHDYVRANFGLLAWQLIEIGVPLVVAMQYPTSPDVGGEFTRHFYESLKTQTVAEAVQAARFEVYGRSRLGSAVLSRRSSLGPVLYMRGDDGVIVSQAMTDRHGDDDRRSSSRGGDRKPSREPDDSGAVNTRQPRVDEAHSKNRPNLQPRAPLPRSQAGGPAEGGIPQ